MNKNHLDKDYLYKHKMISKLAIVILVFLAFLFLFSIAKADSINVPSDYPTIQEAIDNAIPGDTIYISNGIYYENILIDKFINIIGEDKDNTIINGAGNLYVVKINANNINFFNFTITNGSNAGIYLNSDNNLIFNSNIVNNTGNGITIAGASYNNITNNTVTNNTIGILLTSENSNCNQNRIENNTIYENNLNGIKLYSQGTSTTNRVNKNIIRNNTLKFNLGSGIFLHGFNAYGSYGAYCDSNILNDNHIFNNTGNGIHLKESNNKRCRGNHIYSNVIENHTEYGIYISPVTSDNQIHHNDFIDNNINSYDAGNNIWDNGYPSGGNYWDDYSGLDLDNNGIGDTPYLIPGGINQDNYPLMEPFNEQEILPIIDAGDDLSVYIEDIVIF